MTLHAEAHMGLAAEGLVPAQVTLLHEGDPALVHAVIGDGDHNMRQHFLGMRRELPHQLEHARIASTGVWQVYDALQDHELNSVLFECYRTNASFGRLKFTGAVHDDGPPVGRPHVGLQRNTSVMYGQQYVHKVLRNVKPGGQIEVLMHDVLQKAGNPHVARLLGTLDGELCGQRTTFALLHEFQPLAAQGWPMATASVRDYLAARAVGPHAAGGDFAAETQRLGRAVARTHLDLADTLGVHLAQPGQFVQAMHDRLSEALAEVEALRPFEVGLRLHYDAVGQRVALLRLQHVHADLHLGQVLRTPQNWVLIDFEGSPSTQHLMMPALHDVACMLRSLHYAAMQMVVGAPRSPVLFARAMEWMRRNRAAFCRGYAELADDPGRDGVLLRAIELDRAVFEARHEFRHRPEWMVIPLSAISEAVTGESLL